MAYIYLHRRNDTGEVFYVGKGTDDRATTRSGRNQHWHRVVDKAGFTAEIIARGLTDEEAYWVEPLLIEAHGGVENLTNMREGGEGLSTKDAKAQWQDPAYREKISNARKEQWKDPAYREEKSKAMSEQMSQHWQDPAHRERISKAMSEQMLQRWQDPVFREKKSKATAEQMLQQWQDPEYREKISKVATEQNKRRWQDPAYREKMSKGNKRKVECDKCGKMIGICGLTTHQRSARCYNPDIDS